MIARKPGESQRAYVERALRIHGEIRTYDVLYDLAYTDGRKCSITRLAAIIHDLRHDDGWDIETRGGTGETAIYRLRYVRPLRESSPPVPEPEPTFPLEPVRPVAEASLPEWARAWRCAECGGRPAAEPVPLLGDMGRAPCAVCHAARTFRRAA